MERKDAIEFQPMWTNEAAQYKLVEVSPRLDTGPYYVIIHVPTEAAVVIEDDDLYDYVIQRMIEGNVTVERLEKNREA